MNALIKEHAAQYASLLRPTRYVFPVTAAMAVALFEEPAEKAAKTMKKPKTTKAVKAASVEKRSRRARVAA